MALKYRTVMVLTMMAAFVVADTGEVLAQRAGQGSAPIEFSATYGSMWGGNIQTTGGKLRTGTGGSWGLALDYPIAPGTWLEASYTRQDGSLDWDANQQPKFTLTNMSVNFWQLGTIRTFGRADGPIVPYLQGSLGATYFSPSESQVSIDQQIYNIESLTKFSITFGAGFKAYFGQAQRFGIRGSFKFLTTFFDSGGGVFFGPGGVSLGISGSGIWQYEAAGGLIVRFGG